MTDLYKTIEALRRDGQAAVLVTVVASQGHVPTDVASKMLVDASGRRVGTVGGGAIEQRALFDAQDVLRQRQPRLQEYVLDDAEAVHGAQTVPMICGGRMTLFFDFLGAAMHAYLVGAGHCNRALAQYLLPLDFAVTFVDSRPDQLAGLAAPTLQAGDDYATLPLLSQIATSHVVIATHSHVCDERVLEQILAGGVRPPYLGVVASRRKRDAMFAGLRERLGADLDLDWISMPVGLHLGGNAPAAVALSIAAEMQACRHGITGHRHLRDRGGAGRATS